MMVPGCLMAILVVLIDIPSLGFQFGTAINLDYELFIVFLCRIPTHVLTPTAYRAMDASIGELYGFAEPMGLSPDYKTVKMLIKINVTGRFIGWFLVEIEPLVTGHSGHVDMSNHGVSKATITELELEAARDSIIGEISEIGEPGGCSREVITSYKSLVEGEGSDLDMVAAQILADSERVKEDRRMVEEINRIKGKGKLPLVPAVVGNVKLAKGGQLVIKEGVNAGLNYVWKAHPETNISSSLLNSLFPIPFVQSHRDDNIILSNTHMFSNPADTTDDRFGMFNDYIIGITASPPPAVSTNPGKEMVTAFPINSQDNDVTCRFRKVKDLFNSNKTDWDLDKLKIRFSNDIIQEIVQIRMNIGKQRDYINRTGPVLVPCLLRGAAAPSRVECSVSMAGSEVDAAYMAVIDRHPPVALGFVSPQAHPL
ncbi:hypothetical protein MKW98_018355, partial [Papaver atlanticum]